MERDFCTIKKLGAHVTLGGISQHNCSIVIMTDVLSPRGRVVIVDFAVTTPDEIMHFCLL